MFKLKWYSYRLHILIIEIEKINQSIAFLYCCTCIPRHNKNIKCSNYMLLAVISSLEIYKNTHRCAELKINICSTEACLSAFLSNFHLYLLSIKTQLDFCRWICLCLSNFMSVNITVNHAEKKISHWNCSHFEHTLQYNIRELTICRILWSNF